jgi:Transcription factor WhiB
MTSTPAITVAGVLSFLRVDAQWRQDARCHDADSSVFFGEPREPLYPTDEALAYCHPCPVRRQCLDEALKNGLEGTWGGTTEYQRSALLRGRQRKLCPVCNDDVIVPSRQHYQVCVSCGHSWRIGSKDS